VGVLSDGERWKVIHGDCLEVLRGMPDNSVDAVVTDPPYGLGFPYSSYNDTDENLSALVQAFMPECLRIAKRVVVTPGNTNISKYPSPLWHGAWTWDTTTARGPLGWSQWQPILFYGQDVYKGTKSRNGVLKSDRIHFSGGQAKHERSSGMGHCCPKPVAFMNRMIARFTTEGETILDPFAGSGTTGVACVQTGRRFIGIELDAEYVEIARARIAAALEPLAVS
jgi:site-specific DNA-methyltransferase (adenine-specific)